MSSHSQESKRFVFLRTIFNLLISLLAGVVAIIAGLPVVSVFSGVNAGGFPIESSIWFKLLWSLFLASGMIFGISTCRPWSVRFHFVLTLAQTLNAVCIAFSIAGCLIVFRNELSTGLARDCVTFGAMNALAYCYLRILKREHRQCSG